MKEEILELNNYKLHIIHTKRYKTINMSIVFTNEIKKQNITYSNILMDYLNSTNQLYKEKRDIFIKLEDLYNMLNSNSSFRLGNYLITKLEYEFLNPKYTEETMYEETIQFIKDLIFKPDFTNEEVFKRIKLDIQSELDTIKEDPSFYANLKYNEYFGKDTNISLREIGYQESLDETNLNKIEEYYNELLNKSKIDIYLIGDINKKLINIIKDKLVFKTKKTLKEKLYIEHTNIRLKEQIKKDKSDNEQTNTFIGFKLNKLTKEERFITIRLYNLLLGGSPNSYLFKNVREKESLCYTISSYVAISDNILTIYSGINSNNYNKLIKEIKKQIKEIEQGNFKESELEETKIMLLNEYDSIYENGYAALSYKINFDLLGVDLEYIKQNIKNITKKDILNLTKKINIDTIYLLEGK